MAGRHSFTPAEEEAVLMQIRQKRVWPAFADSPLTPQGWHQGLSFVRCVILNSLQDM